MQAAHEFYQRIADSVLAGGASAHDEELLGEHLAHCAACSQHFEAGKRAVDALRGFSFPPDEEGQAKVRNLLRRHARQIAAQRLQRRRMAWIWAIALVLTVAGSFADWQLAGLLARFFHLRPAELRNGLLSGWILPSIGIALFMPFVLLAPSNRRGRSI